MNTVARLDDLRPNRRRSAVLAGQVDAVVTRSVDDVIPAIRSVERASADGLWAVGYIGYEAAPAFDPNSFVRLRRPGAIHSELLLAWFGLFETRALNSPATEGSGDYRVSDWRWIDERPTYEKAVRAIRGFITAGDTYQVNYATRLRSEFEGDPLAFYHDLATAQSGGYGAYLDTGRFKNASASPERPNRHLADEGRGAAGPLGIRRQRAVSQPRGLREGPSRESHHRRPPSQRSRPRRRFWDRRGRAAHGH